MAMKYMMLYFDFLDAMEELSMEERGKVVTFLLAYARSLSTGEDHEALQPGFLDRTEKVVAGIYKRGIDIAHEMYMQKSATYSNNAKQPRTRKLKPPEPHFFPRD